MKNKEHTPSGEAYTALVLETFRLNGMLLVAGDHLVKEFGLSSARWQVLGAIRETAMTVPQIARTMGRTRQSVQRTANILAKDGFVEFCENVNHKRAKLVSPTEYCRKVYDEVDHVQAEWANRISRKLSAKDLESAVRIMEAICLELAES